MKQQLRELARSVANVQKQAYHYDDGISTCHDPSPGISNEPEPPKPPMHMGWQPARTIFNNELVPIAQDICAQVQRAKNGDAEYRLVEHGMQLFLKVFVEKRYLKKIDEAD